MVKYQINYKNQYQKHKPLVAKLCVVCFLSFVILSLFEFYFLLFEISGLSRLGS